MGRFVSRVVVDSGGTPLANAIGQIYDIEDTGNTSPLPIQDLGGTAFSLDQLKANNDGVTPEFTTPGHPRVKWVSGPYTVDMLAWDTIPLGGIGGQVLSKNSADDFDLSWNSPLGIATGGVDGQVLVKDGSIDFVTRWDTIAAGTGGGGTTTGLATSSVAYVRQDLTTHAWPLRPTASTQVLVIWLGVDVWPALVASGTNGPHVGDLLYEIKGA